MKEITMRLTIAWDAVKGVVFDTAYKFHWRFGGDLDDTLSEAQELFIHASMDRDERSSLPTYVRFRIWKGLLSRRRKLQKENARRLPLYDEHYRRETELSDWREGLSSDALTVCECVLEPPIDIECLLADREVPSDWHRRQALRQYLLDKGWNKRRIREAFKEVRKHLREAS